MASLCFSSPPTTITALKPSPPKLLSSSSSSSSSTHLNQIRFRNSVSYPRSLAFNPLRSSAISTSRFSSMASSSSSASSSDSTNEPLWKSLGKSIENFGKKPSVEELLKQQIEKQEYYDEGGGGGNPPGGKGGGGGGDGLGGSEEEGFAEILEEAIQAILATLGFIFMYVYIINGAEMTRLAKDYLTYLFGGRKSIRLTRTMYMWERFCKHVTTKKEADPFWLEKAIVNTRTWWDSPEKYVAYLKSFMPAPPRPDPRDDEEEEDMRDGYDSRGSQEMGDDFY